MPYVAQKSPFSAPMGDIIVASRLKDPLGWVQGYQLDGANTYLPHLGLTTVRELALKHADKTRLVDATEFENLRHSLSVVMAERNALADRVEELEARVDNYVTGFKQMQGRTPPNRMGRPPKEKSA